MTLTYGILRDTKVKRPAKPRKPVEKKIKCMTKFCEKSKGKCNCSNKK